MGCIFWFLSATCLKNLKHFMGLVWFFHYVLFYLWYRKTTTNILWNETQCHKQFEYSTSLWKLNWPIFVIEEIMAVVIIWNQTWCKAKTYFVVFNSVLLSVPQQEVTPSWDQWLSVSSWAAGGFSPLSCVRPTQQTWQPTSLFHEWTTQFGKKINLKKKREIDR